MNRIDRKDLEVLLADTNIKPRLKRDIRFAPEKIDNWQDRDFLPVMNRSNSEGVLIAPLDMLYVKPFHLQMRKSNRNGRVEAIICDFCATWQRGSNSAIISFSKEESTVSFLCCADLLCSLHVRDKTPAATLSRTQLRENNSIEQRVERLRQKLASILP